MRLLAVVYMAPNLQNTTTSGFCLNSLLFQLLQVIPKGEPDLPDLPDAT